MPRVNPAAKAFRSHAAAEFEFLVRDFGYQQERLPRGSNEFSVRFLSTTTRVIVEGINWGMNARVGFGSAGPPEKFEDCDLLDFVAIRCPGEWPDVEEMGRGQFDQLKLFADILRRCGTEVLRGDLSVIPEILAVQRRRREEWERGDQKHANTVLPA